METPSPTDIPKYVETATKTVTDTTTRAMQQYNTLFAQAQELLADGYKAGYKTLTDGYQQAASRIDLSTVPGAETVRPYVERATEQMSERLTVPAEWVDGYFDFATSVIENQRQLTDKVMDNQRQFADRVLVATPAAKTTATAKKSTKSTAKKTAKKATAKSTTKKSTKKTAKK